MQASAAPAWLLVGILLSVVLILLASVADLSAFLFIWVCAFICAIPYLGLLLFRRFFIVDRPAGNKLALKKVKPKRKLQ